MSLPSLPSDGPATAFVSLAEIGKLAPHAHVNYRQAFSNADRVLATYEITTPLRVAHFIAQVMHESGGLTILEENMNYTHAERIAAVWPARFTVSSAKPYVGQPEKLANSVYSGRMGNGDAATGDGWRFRGRGLLQITGRNAYEKYGVKLGINLVGNPDRAFSAEWALPIACSEWRDSACNRAADMDDVRLVTRRVNGGYNGLDEREKWLARTKAIWIRGWAQAYTP